MDEEAFDRTGTAYEDDLAEAPDGRRRRPSAPTPPGRAQARAELQGTIEAVTRVMLRPLGNPLPLGFLALAGATVMTSALQLGWIRPAQQQQVAIVFIAFVFPLQLLTAVLGYLARDTVAGTGMGILAGTWLTVGLIFFTSQPGSTSDALGIFLLLVGGAMMIPASAALFGKLLPALVLLTTAVRFAVTGIAQLSGSATWKTAAGWVGLVLLLVAVYAAWAGELEDVQGRPVLPTFRRAKARMAVEGPLVEQIMDVHHEPGVRKVL